MRTGRARCGQRLLASASLVRAQLIGPQGLGRSPLPARETAGALVPVGDALRAGSNVAERQIELHSGEPRVLGVSASVLRSAAGTAQGGVIAFRDVTAQRDLEGLREDIFSMAWHDMQKPIALIRGHAELLLRRLATGARAAAAPEAETPPNGKHTDPPPPLPTPLL